MGAGGIINQRVSVLLPAVNHSSIYDFLSDDQKNSVEDINQKGPGNYTESDVRTLAQLIGEVVC